MSRSFYRSMALFIGLSLLSGCASTARDAAAIDANKRNDAFSSNISTHTDLIAIDLVSAMMQIADYSPFGITIQVPKSTSVFGDALASTLIASGYGVQHVSSDMGLNYLTAVRSVTETQAGKHTRYSIRVRDLELHRDYEVKDGNIYPTSLVTIVGAKPQRIVVNADMYRQHGGVTDFPNGAEFIDENGSKVEYERRVVSVKPNHKTPVEEAISNQRFLFIARAAAMLTSKLSNDIDVREWPAYKQVVLQFPTGDSRIIGKDNKKAISNILNGFNPDMHGVSLEACHNQLTLLWDGTESDSLDRQRRVFLEVLSKGVPIDLLRENGCFGSEFSEVLPKQAVILTVRLKPNSGV